MITVVGEALIDLVIGGDGVITAVAGGAPFNAARACARLGAPVSLIAAVSTDSFGQRLMADLTADGVETGTVQRTDRPTTLAVAELDAHGAATYRFYLDGTSAVALTPTPLPDGCRAVVAGGLGLAVPMMAEAVERIVLAAAADVVVLLDLNCRPHAVDDRRAYLARLERVLARADVVKASVEDLEYLDPTTPPNVGAARLVAGRPHAVLLTAGPGSTSVVTVEGQRSVPVTAGPVEDTVGAGDCFTAGFLTWWMACGHGAADLDDVDALGEAVVAAHEVAAVVVSRRGADPPVRADLRPDWGPG